MPSRKPESYYDVLTQAIADFAEHGYDDVTRLEYWTRRLREAAEQSATPLPLLDRMMREQLVAIYRALLEKGGLSRYHGELDRYTLARISPRLRAELDRRILASASLIKLNRDQAIDATLRRFSGWATSIPAGGSDAIRKSKTKEEVRKSMKSLPFVERRVLIDQGHKLTSAINDIVAQDGGAIAAVWHSHWRQPGYDYRDEHKDRDGKVYLIKNSWAHAKGYVKPGKAGYFDEITQPGEEVFCRCYATYIYAISALPKDMITKKGADALKEAA